MQLTSSVTIKPTVKGAIILIKFAAQFVMPIKVPAKLGDKSMWFTWKPKYVAAFEPTANVSSAMAKAVLSPVVI